MSLLSPNRTIAILAHVDAGKTTLSEQLLYRGGAVRNVGRVDHGNTVMDTNPIERQRGITVFSDQAVFSYNGQQYTLIDTPGHIDFAAEAERSLLAPDAVILMADASHPIDAHTAMLGKSALQRGLPMVLFLNKCDLNGCDVDARIAEVSARFDLPLLTFPVDPEQLAETDEAFLELFLDGSYSEKDVDEALCRAFRSGSAIPVCTGSALAGQGVEELLELLNRLTAFDADKGTAFKGIVYKIRRDDKGKRVTFVKITGGSVKPRDVFTFGETVEKVHEIRVYHGNRYDTADNATAGDAVGLVGLTVPVCGDVIGFDGVIEHVTVETEAVLAAQIVAKDNTDPNTLLEKLRILEDEDDRLAVLYEPQNKTIRLHVMGPVQLEVLEQVIPERFGISVRFEPPTVLYRETITAPVMGYGHYEPLRHYAEAHLRLEPAPRGSGISFASECHVDVLPLHFQNLIGTHVMERVHHGVLIGAPLTDVRCVLTVGKHHLKHTEGGDFRESTYRAIRQGLMKSKSILLEPYYRFEVLVPDRMAGRVLSELPTKSCSVDKTEYIGGMTCITGSGPVSTLADYGIELRSWTHGEGSAVFKADRYDICHNQADVIAASDYDPNTDAEQPAGSVFCAHGAGYFVPWDEAESMMHCL
ncbi:MAG: TetM/TetW/TetO/TetS family tetracycline resistance ribosomal protection protein [Clostridia bacterium]|nr:TetM/TetW/TetO/TetS family tetracycline resistance ribosomal protection protein [Clostridia bacterium]